MMSHSIVELDRQYVVQTYARADFVIERGDGCYLYDSEGNQYLDCVAGIAVNALGYGDPDVTAAIQKHASGILHLSNLYHNNYQAPLAKMLADSCCVIDRVFFSNSGAEANEGAIKFARRYARDRHGEGKTTVVAFDGSFHGRTMGAVAVTAREKYRYPFAPVMPDVRFGDYNNIDQLDALITADVCAVIIEPVQGEGGFIPAPPEFMRRLRAFCDRNGSLLIADEVQSGFGRTGTLFAIEQTGVEPDLIVSAKSLAAGMPLAATIGRATAMDAAHYGGVGGTYGGNPLACVAALATLDIIERDQLPTRARAIGAQIRARLAPLLDAEGPGPLVGDIRGLGAMLALEFVTDRNSRTPAPAQSVLDILSRALQHGLIVMRAGLYANCIRLLVPLVISDEQLDEGLEILIDAIRG